MTRKLGLASASALAAICLLVVHALPWSSDSTVNTPVSTTEGRKWEPDIATDGTDFLVVWEGADEIEARFVDGSGSPIGSEFDVTYDPEHAAREHSVTFDGTGYIVVWELHRFPGGVLGTDVYGRRVETDGSLGDEFPIAAEENDQEVPTIGSSGSNSLVTWREESDLRLKGRLLNGLTSDDFTISTGIAGITDGVGATRADIAHDGTNYLVVWIEARTDTGALATVGQILATDGTAIGGNFLIGDGPANQFDVAVSAGASYLVTWHDFRNGGSNSDIYAQRVASDGSLLGGNFSVHGGTHHGNQGRPDVAFDGTNYLVAWTILGQYNDVYGQRIAPDGSRVGDEITISNAVGGQLTPAVAYGGRTYVAVWSDLRDPGKLEEDIYAQNVCTNGELGDDCVGPGVMVYSPADPPPTFDLAGLVDSCKKLDLQCSTDPGFAGKVRRQKVKKGATSIQLAKRTWRQVLKMGADGSTIHVRTFCRTEGSAGDLGALVVSPLEPPVLTAPLDGAAIPPDPAPSFSFLPDSATKWWLEFSGDAGFADTAKRLRVKASPYDFKAAAWAKLLKKLGKAGATDRGHWRVRCRDSLKREGLSVVYSFTY